MLKLIYFNIFKAISELNKKEGPADYEFYKDIGVSPWWMNWECWAQSQKELDHVVDTINNHCKDYAANRAQDGAAMKPWELHPRQIASRMKKPNKIAIPYSFWEAGFLFITWYTPWPECAHIACLHRSIDAIHITGGNPYFSIAFTYISAK